MRRRVVITGAGCITPLGSELAEVWWGTTVWDSGGQNAALVVSRYTNGAN